MIGEFDMPMLATRLGAEWTGPAPSFSGVSTDTRTLAAGDLFVALRGEQHDGHHHLDQALAKGAVAAVVEQPVDSALPQLQAYDSRRALGELGIVGFQL